jgi:hypothetical protein
MASSTRRTFSAVDQRRRRCTDLMTSTRGDGVIGSDDIALPIGSRLCLRELRRLSGQNGVQFTTSGSLPSRTQRAHSASSQAGSPTTMRFTPIARWATARLANSSADQPQRACPGIKGQ